MYNINDSESQSNILVHVNAAVVVAAVKYPWA